MASRYVDRLTEGRHGQASEKRLSKSMGSRLMPASGATEHAKSDARLKGKNFDFRIENKSTVNFSIQLEMGWLTKLQGEAQGSASIPLLTVSFVDPTGKPRSKYNSEWCMLPRWAFDQLREAAERE